MAARSRHSRSSAANALCDARVSPAISFWECPCSHPTTMTPRNVDPMPRIASSPELRNHRLTGPTSRNDCGGSICSRLVCCEAAAGEAPPARHPAWQPSAGLLSVGGAGLAVLQRPNHRRGLTRDHGISRATPTGMWTRSSPYWADRAMERTYSRARATQGYALIGILNAPGGALLSADPDVAGADGWGHIASGAGLAAASEPPQLSSHRRPVAVTARIMYECSPDVSHRAGPRRPKLRAAIL